MPLYAYVARRVAFLIPVIFGLTIVVFVLITLIPGDPTVSLLGISATNAERAAYRHTLGLDQPLPVQYLKWLWRTMHLDLGTSLAQHRPVFGIVVTAFQNTAVLAVATGIIAIGIGTALGVVAAVRRNRLPDRAAMGLAAVGTAVPGYWLGLILLVVFSIKLQLLPSGGKSDAFGGGGSVDLLRHLLLPAVAAAAAAAGIIARTVRSSILDVSRLDFVAGLRARGLGEWAIMTRHIGTNAFPTVLTVIGLQLGYLLSGLAFVEVVFSWPGIGSLLLVSISSRDLPVILGVVLFISVVFVIINLLVDVIHAAVDPRVRAALAAGKTST